MEITGEFRIPAHRDRVWRALNDPQVLKQCIPGCQSLQSESDTELTAALQTRVGPVKARFNSRISLTNLDPPHSYTIQGEGKGGPAGFGKGAADVTLEAEGEETVLRYAARLQVGGKLAQIGSRLVLGTARKFADDFFSSFSKLVGHDTTPD